MGKPKVVFFGPQYGVGGAGHVCSDVGKELGRRGYDVDFLVGGAYSSGGYLEDGLPKQCSIVELTDASPEETGNLRYHGSLFWALLRYLRRKGRVTLLSNMTKYNLLSVWASAFAGSDVDLVLIEHGLLEPRVSGIRHALPPLVRTHYPLADQVIGVSNGITKGFITKHGLDVNRCTTVQNPLDVDKITDRADEALAHPWFSEDVPVVLGVGRFKKSKQFSVMIRAFGKLVRRMDARLVLLGDGPRKQRLIDQARSSGVEDKIDFPGLVSNPYKYMRRADVLASSSKHEGFGLVLVEALACGTPVVATDCPGGPSDILAGGEYGPLVDVGNPNQLADAIGDTLEDPPDSARLIERANDFDVSKVADRYETLIRQR